MTFDFDAVDDEVFFSYLISIYRLCLVCPDFIWFGNVPLSAVEWGCHLRQSGTKLVLDVFVAEIYFLFCARVIKLRYGYNILFAHKTQERICACVYQGAVFRSEDQHTSVD